MYRFWRSYIYTIAFFLVVIGLTVALALDKVGSAEVFLSGVALFVFYDLFASKPSTFFGRHRTLFFVTKFAFASAFAILLFVGVFELVYYPAYYWQVSLPVGILGDLLLFLGVGPYAASTLETIRSQK